MTARNQGKALQPCLVFAYHFTEKALFITPTPNYGDSQDDHLMLPLSQIYLQDLLDPNGMMTDQVAVKGLDLDAGQKYNATCGQPVIVWVPTWKVKELGLVPMTPGISNG